jgi:hypothetical protein
VTPQPSQSTNKLLADLLTQTEKRLSELQRQVAELQVRISAVENVSRISISLMRRASPLIARELGTLSIEPHPSTPESQRAQAEAMAAAVRQLLVDAGARGPQAGSADPGPGVDDRKNGPPSSQVA